MMLRTLTLAVLAAAGLAAAAPMAQARDRCPSGFVADQGRCFPLPGRHAPTAGFVPQSGFAREDARRNWNDRYDDRRDWNNRYDDRRDARRYRTDDDSRLRDPERYGLPRLPRGQHYEIVNGQVVRVWDRDSRGYRQGNQTGDAVQGLLQQLLR